MFARILFLKLDKNDSKKVQDPSRRCILVPTYFFLLKARQPSQKSVSIEISHKNKMKNILSNIKIDRNYLVSLVMQTNLNQLARAFGYK